MRHEETFALTSVPGNAYTVHIKGAKWLAKNVSVDATNADVTNLAATLKTGDANNDNYADITDLLLLISHYNQVAPNAGYSEVADFNGDGANGITDLLLLIGNITNKAMRRMRWNKFSAHENAMSSCEDNPDYEVVREGGRCVLQSGEFIPPRPSVCRIMKVGRKRLRSA